jgi:hypothetical protein
MPKFLPILICSICNKRVTVETSKTDEHGDTVHEECYLSQLTDKKLPLKATPY